MASVEDEKVISMHPGLNTNLPSEYPGSDSVMDMFELPRSLEARNMILRALLDASSDAELEESLAIMDKAHALQENRDRGEVIVEFKKSTET